MKNGREKARWVLGTMLLSMGTLLFAGTVRQSFEYDQAGRLIEVRSPGRPDLNESYRYGASGNIVEKQRGSERVEMQYDRANQLVRRTSGDQKTEFVYDQAGRLIDERCGEQVLARYEYGYLDKVISVTRGQEVIRFHYNARGMLVGKERNGQMIDTLGWDGIGLLAKGDTVYANEAHVSGGVPLLSVNEKQTDFYDHDYLGTTTAHYSAEGETRSALHGSLGQGADNSESRFTGKPYDEDLAAHVFPYRNYRSDMGRWTSADPAGFPDGPNQHYYAPVPTLGLDPLGLEIELITNTGVEFEDELSGGLLFAEGFYLGSSFGQIAGGDGYVNAFSGATGKRHLFDFPDTVESNIEIRIYEVDGKLYYDEQSSTYGGKEHSVGLGVTVSVTGEGTDTLTVRLHAYYALTPTTVTGIGVSKDGASVSFGSTIDDRSTAFGTFMFKEK